MITITKEQVESIYIHAAEGYPHEVCGLILGRYDGDDRETVQIRRAPNLNSERAHDRYELDPKELLSAERYCREKGLEVIGIYHTHPDHPDEPSEFDRQRAWPVYSYLIISVKEGKEFTVRSWRLNDETEQFEEEEIKRLEID